MNLLEHYIDEIINEEKIQTPKMGMNIIELLLSLIAMDVKKSKANYLQLMNGKRQRKMDII